VAQTTYVQIHRICSSSASFKSMLAQIDLWYWWQHPICKRWYHSSKTLTMPLKFKIHIGARHNEGSFVTHELVVLCWIMLHAVYDQSLINDYVLSRFILFVDVSCCFILFPRCLLLFHDISPWCFMPTTSMKPSSPDILSKSNFRPRGESLTPQVKCRAPYNGTSTVVCRAYTKWDAVKPPRIW